MPRGRNRLRHCHHALFRRHAAGHGRACARLRRRGIVTMQVVVPGVWRVSYAQYEQALRILAECGARLEDTRFEADVALCFAMLEEGRAALCEKAREFCRGAALLEWQAARCAPF